MMILISEWSAEEQAGISAQRHRDVFDVVEFFCLLLKMSYISRLYNVYVCIIMLSADDPSFIVISKKNYVDVFQCLLWD